MIRLILLVFVSLCVGFEATAAKPQCPGTHPSCGGDDSGGGGVEGTPAFVYSTKTSNSFIRIMDEDGSNDVQLSKTLGSGGGVFGPSPSWSSDGTEVAFSDRKFRKPSGLVVTSLDGNPYPADDPCAGETLCILFQNTDDIETGGVGGDPVAWGTAPTSCVPGSTDQDYIAFLAHGFIHPPSDDDYDLFLISRDNPASSPSELINLTNRPNEWLSGVAWSPDGGSVATFAYSGDFTTGASGSIAIINLCDGLVRTDIKLPDEPLIGGVDSLDWGNQSGQDYLLIAAAGNVWVMDFSVPQSPMLYDVIPAALLAETFDFISAVWSPDGSRIAVSYQLDSGDSGMSIIDVSNLLVPVELSRPPASQPGRIDWKQPNTP